MSQSTNFPARPVVIKLTVPEVQAEFERQRLNLELNAREPLSNEMFIAYLLDIRKAAMDMQTVHLESPIFDAGKPHTEKKPRDIVDEAATEILGHDDPEPKGTVN